MSATAPSYTLNPAAARVRKARLARRSRKLSRALVPIAGLAAVAGVALVVAGLSGGYALLAVALEALVLHLWLSRDVLANLTDLRRVPAAGALEAMLAPDMLQVLPGWPVGAQALVEAAGNTNAGRFIYNRLELHPDIVLPLVADDPVQAAMTLAKAEELARSANASDIDGAAILVAALMTLPEVKRLAKSLKLKEADLAAGYTWQLRVKHLIAQSSEDTRYGGIGRDWAAGYTPTLNQVARNLSREVEAGVVHYEVQAHTDVVQQMAAVLERPAGHSVALIGQPGIGKTTLAYMLAEHLLHAEAPRALRYHQVYSLDASAIISSGANLERLMLTILGEAVHAKNIVLLLDEAQLFFGEGVGAIDISQILLPLLQQSPIKIVITMGAGDMQRMAARMPALTAAVTAITVPEADQASTVAILQDVAVFKEGAARVHVTYPALLEAYRLADRYISEQAFPGKAISLLENALSLPDDSGVVDARSVQRAVERQFGVKVQEAATGERDTLLNLEQTIHQSMINQVGAVKAVADALRRSRAGVANPKRPVGSFLFLGPTGVGKTELTKALAGAYFGGRDRIVRLDMSEYQQPSDVSRLLAASATSRAGNSLVGQIRRQPFSVVLLDEIEKAHPDVLNLLLQLLDEGSLTDSSGRSVSFKDAIIICTSNAGADMIRDRIAAGDTLDAAEPQVVDHLISTRAFRPELINRFDDVVLFTPLGKPELAQVVGLLLAEVNATLAAQNVSVNLDEAAVGLLVERGYDPQFGARPLRRMVQRSVENIVADRLLRGDAGAGDTLTLTAADILAALGESPQTEGSQSDHSSDIKK